MTIASALSALVLGAVVALRQRRRTAERQADGGRTWQCQCGQAFRVSGMDRHRIFWLPEAPENEPVTSGRCPTCDRPLPAGGTASHA